MLQNLGPRDSPQAAASPPPSEEGQARSSGICQPPSKGSSKAETLEGKANGKEKRPKERKVVLCQSGRRKSLKEPQMHSQLKPKRGLTSQTGQHLLWEGT
jgi:hypothetical protein